MPIKLAPMEMYLHDSTETFKFALHGELTADAVQSLEQAWITAMSILGGKEVLVDVSAVTAADAEGIQLLRRMTASGELLRSLGVSVTAPSRRSGWPWMIGLRRRFGLAR